MRFTILLTVLAILAMGTSGALAQDKGILGAAKGWFGKEGSGVETASGSTQSAPAMSMKDITLQRQKFGSVNVSALYDPKMQKFLEENPEVKQLLETEREYMMKLSEEMQKQIKAYHKSTKDLIALYRKRLEKENPELLREVVKQCENNTVELLLEKEGILLPPAASMVVPPQAPMTVPSPAPAPVSAPAPAQQ